MSKQETIDLTDSDAMREKFKDLSISELCGLLREGLNELYCKLRDAEDFSSNVIISGTLDEQYSEVYITNIRSMYSGVNTTEIIEL